MKILKTVGTIILSIFALIGIIFVFLLAFGYRPIVIGETLPDWNAINAVTAGVSALAAIAIPVVVFLLDKRMKQREDETRDRLLKELSDFKNEYEGKLIILSKSISEDGEILATAKFG